MLLEKPDKGKKKVRVGKKDKSLGIRESNKYRGEEGF